MRKAAIFRMIAWGAAAVVLTGASLSSVPAAGPSGAGGGTGPVRTPEATAQALVDAFNAHDVAGAAAAYAPDCVARRLPDAGELLRGREGVRTKLSDLFAGNPGVRVEIVGRVVHGDFVFDREKITGLAGGAAPSFGAVLYEVRDGLIVNEWYLPKTSGP